jgi:hypothetical protein
MHLQIGKEMNDFPQFEEPARLHGPEQPTIKLVIFESNFLSSGFN